MAIKLKHVNKVRKPLADGSVKLFYYHRLTGARLEGEPGSPEFIASYADAQRGKRRPTGATFKTIISEFIQSRDFAELAPSTQKEYRRMLGTIEDAFGDMPLAAINDPASRSVFLAWCDRLAAEGKLREAENRMSILARVLAWGMDRGHLTHHPLASWSRKYAANRADAIWRAEQIEAFVEVAEPEMVRALYVALYSGQRQGDLLKLTWANYRDGVIELRQGKSGRGVSVRCIGRLRTRLDSLRANAVVGTHILTTATGRPWRKRHFSRHFKDTCDRAGIQGLTFHDLRGTAVIMLAEAGATELEIASVTGHSPRSVSAILEKYWVRTKAQSKNAADKLERYLLANSANQLQTTVPRQAMENGK